MILDALVLLCAFLGGFCAQVLMSKLQGPVAPPKPKDVPVSKEAIEKVFLEGDGAVPTGLMAFAVTGKPRKEPWSVRRRELEARERTKRKQMEEFQ